MQYITLSCDSSAKWQVRMNLDYLWSRKLNICSYLTDLNIPQRVAICKPSQISYK